MVRKHKEGTTNYHIMPGKGEVIVMFSDEERGAWGTFWLRKNRDGEVILAEGNDLDPEFRETLWAMVQTQDGG